MRSSLTRFLAGSAFLAAPASFCVLLVLLALAPGCGGNNPLGRQAVSGSITLDGAPLDQGSIQFSPHQRSGVSGGAVITAGAYQIAADKGLPPGQYLVRIFSPVDAQEPAAEEPETMVPGPTAAPSSRGPRQPPPGTERIPPEFNIESTQVVEVRDGGDNAFDFDIRTK